MRRPGLPRLEDARRVRPGPADVEGGDVARGMRLEGEIRDDPVVPAPAPAAGPEEIRVLVRVADAGLPVRRDDRQLLDVVGREPVLPSRPAVAAAQREPGDADGRAGAARDHQVPVVQLRVDVDQLGACPDQRGAAAVRLDEVHAAHVHHDARARRRVAAVGVPAGAANDANAVLPRPRDRLLDVRGRLRSTRSPAGGPS